MPRSVKVKFKKAQCPLRPKRVIAVNEMNSVHESGRDWAINARDELKLAASHAKRGIEVVRRHLHGCPTWVKSRSLLKTEFVHNPLPIEAYIKQLYAGRTAQAKIKTPVHVFYMTSADRIFLSIWLNQLKGAQRLWGMRAPRRRYDEKRSFSGEYEGAGMKTLFTESFL